MARYRYRDAVTGQYVGKAYADANPATTVRERVGLLRRLAQRIKRR